MTALLKLYWGVSKEEGGVGTFYNPWGLREPIHQVEVAGAPELPPTKFVIPAAAKVTIYAPTAPELELLTMRLLTDGQIDFVVIVDKPVSASNSAASGTMERARIGRLKCGIPFCLGTAGSLGHATAATEVAVTDGEPDLWEEAAEDLEELNAYAIKLWNRSAEAHTVELFHIL